MTNEQQLRDALEKCKSELSRKSEFICDSDDVENCSHCKAIAAAESVLASRTQWSKCGERMPTEKDADCFGLVWWFDSGGFNNGVRNGAWSWNPTVFATHWMPTGLVSPEPPKEN